MVEPISAFIVSTAAGVLSSILADLIKGGRRAALQREIEGEVSRRVLQNRGLSAAEVSEIVRRVTDEIKLLALKDPTLRAEDDRIELAKPVRTGLPFHREQRVEKELENRLRQLQETVAARRRELGLPATVQELELEPASKEELCKVPNEPDANEQQEKNSSSSELIVSLDWEAPQTEAPGSLRWKEEIDNTRDRVRRRRMGERVND
jgi:hypothetical protein